MLVHTSFGLQQLVDTKKTMLLIDTLRKVAGAQSVSSAYKISFHSCFFLGYSTVFLESTVGELLLRASHTPSDHIAHLLHCHTVSAGWGPLILSVKQTHSLTLSLMNLSVCLLLFPTNRSSHPSWHNCPETQGSGTHSHKSCCLHSHLNWTARLSY